MARRPGALASILAVALAGAARAQEALPDASARGPVTLAGSQASPLQPDDPRSPWRSALAAGIAGKFGGMRLSSSRENPSVLLFFGGQADGSFGEGRNQGARLRARLFTGGESQLLVPSDGDAEAAYMLGRPELRFVVARLEVARYPALAIQVLAQAGSLPTFEGTLSFASDRMALSYLAAPVEAVWVYYYGGAHISNAPGWGTESDRVYSASAGRLRYTILLPASVALSLQGDLVKLWNQPDVLLSLEGGLGIQVLQRSTVLNVLARWSNFTRRGATAGTTASEAEVLIVGAATLAF